MVINPDMWVLYFPHAACPQEFSKPERFAITELPTIIRSVIIIEVFPCLQPPISPIKYLPDVSGVRKRKKCAFHHELTIIECPFSVFLML